MANPVVTIQMHLVYELVSRIFLLLLYNEPPFFWRRTSRGLGNELVEVAWKMMTVAGRKCDVEQAACRNAGAMWQNFKA